MPRGMPIAPCGETIRLESTGLSIIKYSGALARLPALSEEHQPQLVLLSLGGNDMLPKQPQSQTIANLGRMIDMTRAKGARVVLLATPKPSLAGAVFNNLSPPEFYAEIAKDTKVPLIKDALPEVLSDTALKGDQLPPQCGGACRAWQTYSC
ncbi:MAG: hypothetical protein IPH39_10050 [Sulfuritalea sp.]|nr:hypothetical protein [Sulfuritalea sp.]